MDNVRRAPRVCSTGPTNTLHDLGIRFVDGGEVDVEAVSLLSEPAKANDISQRSHSSGCQRLSQAEMMVPHLSQAEMMARLAR